MYSNARAAIVLVSLLAAGCGGGDDAGNASGDAAMGDDGDVADGAGPDAPTDAPDTVTCADPDHCEWLEGYLGEVLRKLTGVEPAAPGVTITRRATAAQRDVARLFLVDELTRLGMSPTLHDYGSGKNVVVHLPSTTGSTMPRLVVGAHFDGVSAGPAAADNGTGTAIVVAAARYLASRPSRDRAIDLVLFDQEEGGLIGSTAYALELRNDATPVDSVHVMDMISYDGDGDCTL
jgi:acetylornithine deacetylase/succinyl-diaminopimelate desuccinylase-like protein